MTAQTELIERIARVICSAGGHGMCVGFCHSERCPDAISTFGEAATAILPILAAVCREGRLEGARAMQEACSKATLGSVTLNLSLLALDPAEIVKGIGNG